MTVSSEAKAAIIADHLHEEAAHHGHEDADHPEVDSSTHSHAVNHPQRNGHHPIHDHIRHRSTSFADRLDLLLNSPRGTMQQRQAAAALREQMNTGPKF